VREQSVTVTDDVRIEDGEPSDAAIDVLSAGQQPPRASAVEF